MTKATVFIQTDAAWVIFHRGQKMARKAMASQEIKDLYACIFVCNRICKGTTHKVTFLNDFLITES